ncbi:MAG: hypothetical protein ACR2KE_03610 [Candidatus Nanopelagicales bacterium]
MRPRRLVIALLAGTLLASSGTALAAPTGSGAPRADAPSYIAVIDAGSSGTRLLLYASTPDTLAASFVMKSSPGTAGLSSFASSPASAGPDAISPLLGQLDARLATDGVSVSDVPVALLATAGMRALRLKDPAGVDAIFASTEATLDASGHPVLANRILPEVKEATFAWLDANALAGTLDRKVGSIGTVEVGGASAQVAFRSLTSGSPLAARVVIQGQVIHVNAVSYLGLGSNMARDSLQQRTEGAAFCFPNNASGKDPENYLATTEFPVKSDTATYHQRHCVAAYGRTIATMDTGKPVAPSELRTLSGFQASTFVGLGAIGAVFQDLKIDTSDDERAALDEAVHATCPGADAWPRVQALYSTPSPFAETVCSTSSYLSSFLFGRHGVGVDPRRFSSRSDTYGRAPSWPAGFATARLHP